MTTDTTITRITKKDKLGKEVTYKIEAIENGFLVNISKEGKDKKGAWQYETKRYYTKENPIQKEAPNMFEIIEGALGMDKKSL